MKRWKNEWKSQMKNDEKAKNRKIWLPDEKSRLRFQNMLNFDNLPRIKSAEKFRVDWCMNLY